jgi:hypothetical protein
VLKYDRRENWQLRKIDFPFMLTLGDFQRLIFKENSKELQASSHQSTNSIGLHSMKHSCLSQTPHHAASR